MEASIYTDMHRLENRHWWFLARRKIISKMIQRLAAGNSLSIFDAGCGNGDNLAMLSEFGPVVAMEKEQQALQLARQREICEVYAGELPGSIPEQIARDNNLIVLLDVLEHIEDDSRCLQQLGGWLAADGRLLITVPAYQFLWSQHDELHHHHRRYSCRGLEVLLHQNNWQVEYISYFNTLLFPLAVADRMLKKLNPSNNDDVLKLPHSMLNSMLYNIFRLESGLIGKVSLPYGLSILAVARRQG